ncbi:P-loop containing nucleoside triphosphate hydrolase protein [Camillea tinctor]|nr:P-loop containing nucleoside triphosphate hydrolase protein [Camillea tinctor]
MFSPTSSRPWHSQPGTIMPHNPTNASTKQDHIQLLKGLDIMPMEKDSTGAEEASKFGYSTQLVINWYRHQCPDCGGQERWSEYAHQVQEQESLSTRNSRIPIIHRFIQLRKAWVTDSITIQDKSMQEVIRDVLRGYQDFDPELVDWTFKPPFMQLVHRWDEIKEYQVQAQDTGMKNAASALLSFLAPILAEHIVSRTQTENTRKIQFEDIWQIFSPGTLVCTKFYGVDAVFRVIKYEKRHARDSWAIEMEYIDWNGDMCGYTSTTIHINIYDGHRWIMDLPAIPLTYLPNESSFRAEMIQRGRKFERLRGFHFMRVNGTKIRLEREIPDQRPVAGKVCVDAHAYYQSLNLIKPMLRSFPGGDSNDSRTGSSISQTTTSQAVNVDYVTEFTVLASNSPDANRGNSKRNEDLTPLTEEQLLLASPWLKGFDLKDKDWCELRVDELEDMTWNDEAFEKLILPGNEKNLAWEFVDAKSHSDSGFDDFIPDKGRGLIILMFGPPGVGKTFTAEAVAERSRVPLYSMSAGDLGTYPGEVERSLKRALDLCKMWNAMLLLDEADVFLTSRDNDSLARNELVSIFLRLLEYYQGILFLTTNRIASVDHAFRSRIDLLLPYHDLTSEARRQVWENFIDHAGREKFEVDSESLDRLAQLPLNGREIKNLIKSAHFLSFRNGSKVPMDRIYALANGRAQTLKILEG